MIWFNKQISLDELKPLGKGTMSEWVGMEWVEIGEDYLKARMPVDHRTIQPYGLLHGGASVALAETLGSVASALVVDSTKFNCVGVEINANHIRSAREGFVIGTAKPLHLGKTIHVWEIRIHDEQDRLICMSRLTTAVLPKK